MKKSLNTPLEEMIPHLIFLLFSLYIFLTFFKQTSYIFQEIFNTIGSFSKLAGVVLMAYGFLSVFIRKRIGIGALIFGAVLLWIGAFLTYTPFTFSGIDIGNALPPVGYH